MDKRKALSEEIWRLGLNLYDAAIMDDDGVEYMRFQPSNICNNSYSVAKAFTMTAVGLLCDDGALSVQSRITQFFPEWERDDETWAGVTIEHALKHMIGFADGFLDIDEDNPEFLDAHRSADYLELVRRQKFGYAPGTHYAYSDTAYYILSRVIAVSCGKTVDELVRQRLAVPMGFGSIAWSRCPAGFPMAATGLYLSAGDMVKLAWLYLKGGVYKGARLLCEDWVNRAVRLGYEFNPVYGTGLIGKGGMYCQMLLFSPKGGFAAAWHGHSPNGSDRDLIGYLNDL